MGKKLLSLKNFTFLDEAGTRISVPEFSVRVGELVYVTGDASARRRFGAGIAGSRAVDLRFEAFNFLGTKVEVVNSTDLARSGLFYYPPYLQPMSQLSIFEIACAKLGITSDARAEGGELGVRMMETAGALGLEPSSIFAELDSERFQKYQTRQCLEFVYLRELSSKLAVIDLDPSNLGGKSGKNCVLEVKRLIENNSIGCMLLADWKPLLKEVPPSAMYEAKGDKILKIS